MWSLWILVTKWCCNAQTGRWRIANLTGNDLRTLRNHSATNRRPVTNEAPINRRLVADQSPIGCNSIAKSSHPCLDETDRRTIGNQSAMKIGLFGDLSETYKSDQICRSWSFVHAQKTARDWFGSAVDQSYCGDVEATSVKPFWDLATSLRMSIFWIAKWWQCLCNQGLMDEHHTLGQTVSVTQRLTSL